MALEAVWQLKMDALLLIADVLRAEKACLPDLWHTAKRHWSI